MYLSQARRGDVLEILRFPDGSAALQARRLGLSAGAQVRCTFAIAGGPVVISAGSQQIALGRPLARNISVRRAGLTCWHTIPAAHSTSTLGGLL